MSNQNEKIMAFFNANNFELTTDTIVSLTKMKRKSVHGRLSELVKWGKLVRTGRSRYKKVIEVSKGQ